MELQNNGIHKFQINQNGRMIKFKVPLKYKELILVGFGAYGFVCFAKQFYSNDQYIQVAIKKIPNIFDNLQITKQIIREIKTLTIFQHRNIIKYREILPIVNPLDFKQIYLSMQYMNNDLHKLMENRNTNPIDNQDIRFIMYQLFSAIYYMHSANIAHLDIKPNNILVNQQFQVKLCDMGFVRKIVSDEQYTKCVHILPYKAPQLLFRQRFTKSVDIWALGCIFIELLTGTNVFKSNPNQQTQLNVLMKMITFFTLPNNDEIEILGQNCRSFILRNFPKGLKLKRQPWSNYSKNVTHQASDLLEKIFVYDYRQRYTARQCLQHDYFAQYRNQPLITCEQQIDLNFQNVNQTQNQLRNLLNQTIQKSRLRLEQNQQQQFNNNIQ